MNISAIVTAAGLSKRMGKQNKLLLDFNGKPLLHYIIDELLRSNVGEIIVVCGHEKESVMASLVNKKVKICFNENYKSGLTSSIQCGVKFAESNSDAYLIALSDMPFIKAELINKLIEKFHLNHRDESSKQIVVPQIKNRNSHPAIFSKDFKTAILAHQKNNGCKQIILDNMERVIFVKLDNERFGIDIDDLPTLEKYKQ